MNNFSFLGAWENFFKIKIVHPYKTFYNAIKFIGIKLLFSPQAKQIKLDTFNIFCIQFSICVRC